MQHLFSLPQLRYLPFISVVGALRLRINHLRVMLREFMIRVVLGHVKPTTGNGPRSKNPRNDCDSWKCGAFLA